MFGLGLGKGMTLITESAQLCVVSQAEAIVSENIKNTGNNRKKIDNLFFIIIVRV